MSAVNVTNVAVLDNPSMFKNPFQFEISYECLVSLEHGELLASLLCLHAVLMRDGLKRLMPFCAGCRS
jgi:hypothetical protein